MPCSHPILRRLAAPAALALAVLLGACARPGSAPAEPPPRREVAVAVTASQQLIRFNAGRPERILSRVALTGLLPGEQIVGIDYRAKNDTLYALGLAGGRGRLLTVDTDTGAVSAVGAALAVSLQGSEFGFDFNPTVDRIRVVSGSGQNLRLHPDTGAVVDANPGQAGLQVDATLAWADGDRHARTVPRVVAAAYSYNKDDPKVTTNFVIDAATGQLATQGSREGLQPVVSPNGGRLFSVGPLGAGPFHDAAFDIHVLTDVGFVALTAREARSSRWVEVDLKTGAARLVGVIGGGEPVRAVALESW